MSIARAVVGAMERVAPLRLAEKWDNVGLLVESPFTRENAKRILLTIEYILVAELLVLEEALSTPTSVILSYHPPIFRPLTSLTLSNPLQASLLNCAATGISIFSPHTALDCVKGGINDWLAQGLGKASVRVIEAKEGEDGAGSGRIVTYQNSQPLGGIATSIKAHLGLKYIQVASASGSDSALVKSVAICAGSGGSMLKDVEADLYFTGEMSHHEVLAAIAKGTHVILCGHDNTERGYLPILRDTLQKSLSSEQGGPFEVVVSKRDRHPFEIV